MELARFPRLDMARAFIQALAAEGIEADVREQPQGFFIVLRDESQRDRARDLLDAFIENPEARRFQDALWQQGEPAAPTDQRPLFTGGWITSMGRVTRTLFFLNVAIFLAYMVAGQGVYEPLMFPAEPRALANQPWRLVTPMLLHFSLLHIIFNMLWWVELGRIIETFQSGRQLIFVTLATGMIANIAQYLDTGPRFGGMSGVVYGLLGYLWIYGRVNPAAGYGLRREVVFLMLAWLVICFVGLADIVANQAHLFGLLSGCALGGIVGGWRRGRYYSG